MPSSESQNAMRALLLLNEGHPSPGPNCIQVEERCSSLARCTTRVEVPFPVRRQFIFPGGNSYISRAAAVPCLGRQQFWEVALGSGLNEV